MSFANIATELSFGPAGTKFRVDTEYEHPKDRFALFVCFFRKHSGWQAARLGRLPGLAGWHFWQPGTSGTSGRLALLAKMLKLKREKKIDLGTPPTTP